ncbi:hypothetical protein [Achromobacter spanius]|uniref:hypothetical protein n=1 Tax=Achromobacter spanius TaxID=217203 RepID=UPI003A8ED9FA
MSCACPGECSPQHGSSPGVVDNDELILLVLVNPITYKDGDLSSSSFSASQLKKGIQSVCRVRHSTAEQVDRCVVTPLMKKSGRTFHGSAAASAGDIRAIQGADGEQAFCVVDDPIHEDYVVENRPEVKPEVFLGHAHIGFSTATQNETFWRKNNKLALMATLALKFKGRGCPLPIEHWYA